MLFFNGLYSDHRVTITILGNLDCADPTAIAQALERLLFGQA